jgi:hypothetical protein
MPLIGEPCPDARCAEIGATCVNQICVAVGLPDTACAGDDECSPFTTCGAASTCADIPQLGESCTTTCTGESFCDLQGTCAPTKADGDFCDVPAQCASQLCKEGPTNQCVARPLCF